MSNNEVTTSVDSTGKHENCLTKMYVKVLPESNDSMVAFEFAIGWPDMTVELVLERAQFDLFCKEYSVIRLPDGPSSVQVELERLKREQ
jgi:phenol/toluene 2-monooxygenase (NADH) P0/A0